MPIWIANALMIMYLKCYENDSANFLNYENFLSCHIQKRTECLCRFVSPLSVLHKNRDFVVLLCVVWHFFFNQALAIKILNLTGCSFNRTSVIWK